MPEGFRVVMNNGESANQNYLNLYVQVLGGQQLSWPPGVPSIEESIEKLTIEEPIPEAKKDDDTQKTKLKNEIFIKELGFSHVVEMMIEAQKKRAVPVIGHNMMYDLLYFYNQFIGPLPDTFE